MSEITTIREKVKERIESAYSKVDTSISTDAVSIMLDDSLSKDPIEYQKGIVRHISIDPKDNKDYADLNPRHEDDRDKILRDVYGRVRIEVMPKLNINKNKMTVLDMLGKMYDAISSPDNTPIEGPWLEKGTDDDDPLYQNVDRLMFSYVDADRGYVNLVESRKGKNEFAYPKFNGYSAPTLSFHLLDVPSPHTVEGPTIKWNFGMVDRTYQMLQKLKQD